MITLVCNLNRGYDSMSEPWRFLVFIIPLILVSVLFGTVGQLCVFVMASIFRAIPMWAKL